MQVLSYPRQDWTISGYAPAFDLSIWKYSSSGSHNFYSVFLNMITSSIFELALFFKYFFWRDLPRLAVFIISHFSAIKWSFLYPSRLFRWTWGSNPRQRTMAHTVSPQCSPLDQGTSLELALLWIFFTSR